MRSGNFFSQNQVRELFLELVRMWQQVGKSRAGAIRQTCRDIGMSERKGRRISYYEPHIISDLETHNAENHAEDAWLKIADVARQTAEYCEAQAELSRIRKRQGELFERGVGCSKFTRSLRKSAAGSNGLLYAAPIGALCAALIG